MFCENQILAISGFHNPCPKDFVRQSNCPVCWIVLSGILMYVSKQVLFHLPSCLINQDGTPAAAAVVAAPIQKECVDIGQFLL